VPDVVIVGVFVTVGDDVPVPDSDRAELGLVDTVGVAVRETLFDIDALELLETVLVTEPVGVVLVVILGVADPE